MKLFVVVLIAIGVQALLWRAIHQQGYEDGYRQGVMSGTTDVDNQTKDLIPTTQGE